MCITITTNPPQYSNRAVLVRGVSGMCKKLTDITGLLAQRFKNNLALIKKHTYTHPVIPVINLEMMACWAALIGKRYHSMFNGSTCCRAWAVMGIQSVSFISIKLAPDS